MCTCVRYNMWSSSDKIRKDLEKVSQRLVVCTSHLPSFRKPAIPFMSRPAVSSHHHLLLLPLFSARQSLLLCYHSSHSCICAYILFLTLSSPVSSPDFVCLFRLPFAANHKPVHWPYTKVHLFILLCLGVCIWVLFPIDGLWCCISACSS